MRRTEVKRLRRLNLVLNKTRRFRVYDPSSEPETFLFLKTFDTFDISSPNITISAI